MVDDAGLSEEDCDGVSTDAIIWGDDGVVPTMTDGGDTTIGGLFVIDEGISKFSSSSDCSDVVGKIMDIPTAVRAEKIVIIFWYEGRGGVSEVGL